MLWAGRFLGSPRRLLPSSLWDTGTELAQIRASQPDKPKSGFRKRDLSEFSLPIGPKISGCLAKQQMPDYRLVASSHPLKSISEPKAKFSPIGSVGGVMPKKAEIRYDSELDRCCLCGEKSNSHATAPGKCLSWSTAAPLFVHHQPE
jgi:hypothetical protein